MYFDIAPKEKREDLFGASYQLELLEKYLLDKSVRIVVIKGLRRTGKTSLLNVALNGINIKSIKIDVRDAPFYDKREFKIFLVKKIKDKMNGLVNKILRKISGLKVSYEKFSFELFFSKEENISLFFQNFDASLRKKRQTLILAFDEAQLLNKINFDYFLASVFDNYKSIKLVLTGSEVGVMDKFLGKTNYNAPLFGRAYMEIESKRLKEEQIAEFLKKGFKQMHKKIEFEEIQDIIESLDGNIGWAVYYGWFRYKGLSHKDALEKVKEEGKAIAKREFENFLQGRKAKIKYLKIVKYLTKGKNDWKAFKQAFIKEGLKIQDAQLNSYLKEMIDFGFVEKIGEKYFIADPLLGI